MDTFFTIPGVIELVVFISIYVLLHLISRCI